MISVLTLALGLVRVSVDDEGMHAHEHMEDVRRDGQVPREARQVAAALVAAQLTAEATAGPRLWQRWRAQGLQEQNNWATVPMDLNLVGIKQVGGKELPGSMPDGFARVPTMMQKLEFLFHCKDWDTLDKKGKQGEHEAWVKAMELIGDKDNKFEWVSHVGKMGKFSEIGRQIEADDMKILYHNKKDYGPGAKQLAPHSFSNYMLGCREVELEVLQYLYPSVELIEQQVEHAWDALVSQDPEFYTEEKIPLILHEMNRRSDEALRQEMEDYEGRQSGGKKLSDAQFSAFFDESSARTQEMIADFVRDGYLKDASHWALMSQLGHWQTQKRERAETKMEKHAAVALFTLGKGTLRNLHGPAEGSEAKLAFEFEQDCGVNFERSRVNGEIKAEFARNSDHVVQDMPIGVGDAVYIGYGHGVLATSPGGAHQTGVVTGIAGPVFTVQVDGSGETVELGLDRLDLRFSPVNCYPGKKALLTLEGIAYGEQHVGYHTGSFLSRRLALYLSKTMDAESVL